jgi:hypothetical protein
MMAEAKPRGGAVSAGKIGDGVRLRTTRSQAGRIQSQTVEAHFLGNNKSGHTSSMLSSNQFPFGAIS